jgi:hypothetical protein
MSEDQAQSEPVAQPQPTTPEQHVMMMASHHAMSQHNTTMMAAILALQAQVQASPAFATHPQFREFCCPAAAISH